MTRVPKLRLPEFQHAPQWEERTVCEFGKISTGSTPSTSNQDYWNGGYTWVTPTDISGNKAIFASERTLTEAGMNHAGHLPKNTVLITCIASIGKNAILRTEGSCNQQINAIIPNEGYSPDFLYYLFETRKQCLLNRAGISATRIISKSQFQRLNFLVPSWPEQQKIADCLSSLDELIAAHTQKLDALKTGKKALMQQLFPAEGKTLPKLRFPEFRHAPRWEEKRLDEISSINCGGTPSRNNAEYWHGDIRWISSKYFSEDHRIIGHEFITRSGVENSATTIAPKGATLMVSRVSVGKYAFSDQDYAINQDITSLMPADDIVPEFLFSAAHIIAQKIERNAIGTGIKGVTQAFIAGLKILFPAVEEQQKIVDCLASLDMLIAAQGRKLDTLKQHKKGLMQQLFPSADDLPKRLFEKPKQEKQP